MAGNRHRILAALTCGLLAWALAVLAAPLARADISSPTAFGADESVSGAGGPLAGDTTYSGAFVSSQDIDYLYFEVPQPETLRFDIVNTLSGCPAYFVPASPPEPAYYEYESTCPMWATLIDGSGQQLGGEGSAAGTGPVEYHSFEEIEWSFSAAGRYYLVLESSYNPYEQLPAFQLSHGVVPPGGGGSSGGGATGGGTSGTGASGGGGTSAGGSAGKTGGGSSGGSLKGGEVGVVEGRPGGSFTLSGSRSLIDSLTLARRQRGTHVSLTVVLAQRLASLDLELLARIGRHHRLTLVGHRLRRHPIAGRERIAVPVRAGSWLTSRRYVPLVLRVRALAGDGAAELIQGRLLLRR